MLTHDELNLKGKRQSATATAPITAMTPPRILRINESLDISLTFNGVLNYGSSSVLLFI